MKMCILTDFHYGPGIENIHKDRMKMGNTVSTFLNAVQIVKMLTIILRSTMGGEKIRWALDELK